ncbi:MAG: hypothetical protein COS37_07250 [Anaerolineae bacterium CG03_land_8_20_14_0_80_58_20]|nr:MAG: hypothetical protein COS37_07250 [Anaerolineae bacterium CG03_land_8_20_14_0_80_58_20]
MRVDVALKFAHRFRHRLLDGLADDGIQRFDHVLARIADLHADGFAHQRAERFRHIVARVADSAPDHVAQDGRDALDQSFRVNLSLAAHDVHFGLQIKRLIFNFARQRSQRFQFGLRIAGLFAQGFDLRFGLLPKQINLAL